MTLRRTLTNGLALAVLLGSTVLPTGCSKVPVTGRQQLNLIPSSTILSMSNDEYDTFLKEHRLSGNTTQVQLVRRVGSRIQQAVETYFRQHDLSSQLDGYAWEFNLVEDKAANAWCMPGGKVVVYTGILPVTQTEAGLAVVMGHEIAHAVAEHGNERMSQGLLTQLGGLALSEALSSKPAQTRQIWMTAFGVGTQVGALLPFSRLQESEADRLGLIFMAMAGYNPNEAVSFWERMSANSSGAPPEFLSTHPSDRTRIANLQKEIPEAMRYYNQS
ncbi:MAG TPA: M48 family metallopeptidase [Candidatus Eisenbacteria bacterium]